MALVAAVVLTPAPCRLRSAALLVALSAAAAGCGGDEDGFEGSLDDGGGANAADGPAAGDAGADGAPIECPLAGGCPIWIEAYERDVVSALSGARPIADGVTLSQRTTAAEREVVRDYLSAELSRWGLEPDLHEYGGGANVFAELGGARIVLGAHYDGVAGAPAAADDGTGVALVLAAARYLSALERRDAAVLFVLFDEEEVGLLGSQAFAEKLRFEAVPALGMHNFDMLSWDADGDRGVELWAPDPALEELYRAAAADLAIPVASFPNFYSSDHAAFIAAGFAALGVGEEFHQGDSTPHYHQPSDTYDEVDFDYLLSSTRLAFLAIERQLGAGR